MTFDSGVDPAFRVDRAVVTVLVDSVAVYYGNTGTTTQTRVDVVPAGVQAPVAVNALTMGFAFSDLEYDCRSRAGGDPTSDVGGSPMVHPAPIGALTIVRQ